jgi:hypothetical protein
MKLPILRLLGFVFTVSLMNDRAIAQVPLQKSPFSATTWKNDLGDSRIRFEPDGKWSEDWGRIHYGGTWKAFSKSDATVERDDGKTLHFRISADEKSASRKDPPCHYTREGPGQSPLSTDTSLSRGAFDKTKDKKYRDEWGNTYWKDIQGRRRYDW